MKEYMLEGLEKLEGMLEELRLREKEMGVDENSLDYRGRNYVIGEDDRDSWEEDMGEFVSEDGRVDMIGVMLMCCSKIRENVKERE